MPRSTQEFTFINVTSGKKQNTRAIKRHVSNQTNRRKRQEAVLKYQQSLLEAADPPSSSSEASVSPGHVDEKDYSTATSRSSHSHASSEDSSPSEHEEEYREFGPQRQLARRQPFKVVDFWPAYQAWAREHLSPTPSPPQQKRPSPLKGVRKPDKAWKLATTSSQSHIWATIANQDVTIRIPRIDPPTEQYRLESASRICRDFIHGTYESNWRAQWQNGQWYAGKLMPLGIWRECFPLSVELIQAGKLQQAFFILNTAFNVTPGFIKENNPGLLIACLGAMMWSKRIADKRLSTLIRSHITHLSMAHLGREHPISLLLREQMQIEEADQGQIDLLSLVVLDAVSDCFGPTHYVPLSMRFGYLRRQLSNGDHDAALAAIGKLEESWNSTSMPASQLPSFLAFEKTKVIRAQQRAIDSSPTRDVSSARDLGKVAEGSIQLPVFVPGHGPTLQAPDREILKKLGKHLLLSSHYALALYIYSHMSSVFDPCDEDDFSTMTATPMTNQELANFPRTVARILVRHLQLEQEPVS